MMPVSENSSDNSAKSNSSLNRARIEDGSSPIFSPQKLTPRNRSFKSLPSDSTQSLDFRSSFSQMIDEENEKKENSIFCTPTLSRDKITSQRTYGKTVTIRGKKGLLYREICPICLGQFDNCKGSLACRHSFCGECIQQWAKTSNQCPCCRQKFTQIQKVLKNGDTNTVQVTERQAVFEESDYYICYNCGRGDDEHVLLICDSCDFYCCHIYCDPVLRNNIPEGDWFCKYCEERVSRGSNNPNLSVSSIESREEESAFGDLQNSQPKAIATRTRSRETSVSLQQSNARILQRLRRNR